MNLKLIVISPPGMYTNECRLVCSMFAKGLKKYHLRKPGWSAKRLEKLLGEFPVRYRKSIIIHSHYYLQKKWKLGGVHLTEKTRAKRNITTYKSKAHSLSSSFHKLADLQQQGDLFDYVFLSPVFNSISKKGYFASFNEVELKEFLTGHRNVIALGGVTPLTLSKIKKMGFAGAATLGYIWESKDPVKAFTRLVSKIK